MLGQHRSPQCRIPRGRADEERLVADMIELAPQYGRYRPPAPETIVTLGWPPGSATLRRTARLAEKSSMH